MPDLNLAKFAKWCVTEGCFEGYDLDGGSVQEQAVKCGIIEETKYDPAKHGTNNVDADEGDRWFVFTEAFKACRGA